jgi:Tol biopolymer transport system component
MKVAFVTNGRLKVFDYPSKSISSWSGNGQFPSWSPDGATIAFIDQFRHPHLINPDGTNERISPSSQSYASRPLAWSPDSKWLVALDFAAKATVIEVATWRTVSLANSVPYTSVSWR